MSNSFKPWQIAILAGLGLLIVVIGAVAAVLALNLQSTPPISEPEEAAEAIQPSEMPILPPTNILPPAPPSDTPLPTASPTPMQTYTPIPSRTPLPSLTPAKNPAAAIETPVIYSGTGDSTVELVGKGLMHITGDPAGGRFIVTADKANTISDKQKSVTMIDTDKPYDGIRAHNLGTVFKIYTLHIQTTGDWKIELLPFSTDYAPLIKASDKVQGISDKVFTLSGEKIESATLRTKGHRGPFELSFYGKSWSMSMSSPYDADNLLYIDFLTVKVDREPIAVAVVCNTPWTLEFHP